MDDLPVVAPAALFAARATVAPVVYTARLNDWTARTTARSLSRTRSAAHALAIREHGAGARMLAVGAEVRRVCRVPLDVVDCVVVKPGRRC